jgi:hypothetical protein
MIATSRLDVDYVEHQAVRDDDQGEVEVCTFVLLNLSEVLNAWIALLASLRLISWHQCAMKLDVYVINAKKLRSILI